MKITRRGTFFFWLAALVSFGHLARADGSFKVLPSSVSLDGRSGVAYGVNDLTRLKLSDLMESPKDDEDFDQRFVEELRGAEVDEPRNLKNYLVDLRTRRAVAVIPGFRYFPGNNKLDLEVGWSVGGQRALAIYPRRWNYSAIVWIESRTGLVTDVGKELEAAFRKVLTQQEGKAYTRRADEYAVSFFDPIITEAGQLILGVAGANIPKSEARDFDYRLRFRVMNRGGKPHFILISACRGGDWEYDQPFDSDNADEELARVLRRLSARLHMSHRRAFEREQAKWQNLVAALPGGERDFCVARRVRELNLRLREL